LHGSVPVYRGQEDFARSQPFHLDGVFDWS